MDGDAVRATGEHSIGESARLTGLTVKAIRFYSDRGIVPPAGRSPAGYRRYGADALARLHLVRTLRDLGLDLPTIRKVLDREATPAEVAAAHADALAAQIEVLRLRRAVLTVVARRGSTPEEMGHMHELAKLSEDGRRRLVDDFLGTAFGGLGGGFTGIARSMTPELPDDPDVEQVEAWVELAGLALDPDFRAHLRRIAEHHAAERAEGGDAGVRPDPVSVIRDEVGPALAAGVDPASVEAGAVVAAVRARFPHLSDLRLADLSETADDPRRERYLRLLAVVNGWEPPEGLAPALGWFVQALRARAGHDTTGAPAGSG